jgi:protein-disulfide isomerase
MHDLLFEKQDSLGLKQWDSFATEARVGDLRSFSSCAAAVDTISMIERGLSLGSVVGVHGTPTVVINGVLYSRPPSDSLQQIVARLIAGK